MVVCARLVLVTAALRPSIAIQSCFPQFEGFNRSVFSAAGRLKPGKLPFTSLAPNTVSVDRSGLTSPAPLELLAQVNAEDAAASSESKRIMSISQRSAINERDDGGSRERVTFSFGKNWFQFIKRLTPQIVASAELDLKNWLPGLAGKRVLDVGSGSGLSSLAFLRLGAAEVVSFDYDKYSVAATMRLRENRSQGGGWGGGTWHVFRGSVLDSSFVWHLGRFDIVFSWGVLHHTGQMHRALANLAPVVRPDGMLMVTLYQGGGKCVLLPAIPRAKAQPIAFPGCLGYIALTPCSESLHPPQPAAALA